MKSMKHAGPNGGGEDADTLAFLDNVFAGRWMSSVGETGEEDFDIGELQHITSQKSGENEPEPVEPQPPVCGDFAKHDLWNVMQESQLGQELRQIYLQRQLSCDLFTLVFMTGLVMWLPV
ncbi:unnamed protein product [Symbiodinium natans]|uniref:Uncharacterized protein n=1 Tax=Symbiodinium natans TaxID=878477 RepID=A0A812UUX9_9DINO|nr:unnamed protein product [Symbiodinium natans]